MSLQNQSCISRGEGKRILCASCTASTSFIGSGMICLRLDCCSGCSGHAAEDVEDSPDFSNQHNSDISYYTAYTRKWTHRKCIYTVKQNTKKPYTIRNRSTVCMCVMKGFLKWCPNLFLARDLVTTAYAGNEVRFHSGESLLETVWTGTCAQDRTSCRGSLLRVKWGNEFFKPPTCSAVSMPLVIVTKLCNACAICTHQTLSLSP